MEALRPSLRSARLRLTNPLQQALQVHVPILPAETIPFPQLTLSHA